MFIPLYLTTTLVLFLANLRSAIFMTLLYEQKLQIHKTVENLFLDSFYTTFGSNALIFDYTS